MILKSIPAFLIGCSITSGVAASRWVPADSSFIGKVFSRRSKPPAGSELLGRDVTAIPEMPPPAGPQSICDNVPVDTWISENGIVYTGVAINSMYLCIADGSFTQASQTRLHSALISTELQPRINTMCKEYSAGIGAGDNVLDWGCPSFMIGQIEDNTLLNVSFTDGWSGVCG